MKIISHRGFWRAADEKNTEAAFVRSFHAGFGVETDVRDLDGTLVISHEPPRLKGMVLTLNRFLAMYERHGNGLPLTLRVRAEGLEETVARAARDFELSDYLLCATSVPDALAYLRRGLPVATRHSDHEPSPAFYGLATGVWIDAFGEDWATEGTVRAHLDAGKRVYLASPERHGRPHLPFWKSLRGWGLHRADGVMLGTDYPDEARAFFTDGDAA